MHSVRLRFNKIVNCAFVLSLQIQTQCTHYASRSNNAIIIKFSLTHVQLHPSSPHTHTHTHIHAHTHRSLCGEAGRVAPHAAALVPVCRRSQAPFPPPSDSRNMAAFLTAAARVGASSNKTVAVWGVVVEAAAHRMCVLQPAVRRTSVRRSHLPVVGAVLKRV